MRDYVTADVQSGTPVNEATYSYLLCNSSGVPRLWSCPTQNSNDGGEAS